MLVRLFPQNKARNILDSRISPAIDYVLGAKDAKGISREYPPVVLRGDPVLMKMQLAAACASAPYVSGSLNFTESYPDRSKGSWDEILAGFSEVMYPGVLPVKPHCLDVLHRKARDRGFEFHFIGLNEDPGTGQALSPIVPMRDGKLLAAWTQFINLSHGLTSPFDPTRLRLMTIPKRHRKSAKRSFYEEIQGLIWMEIEQGRITSRRDVMEWFRSGGYSPVLISGATPHGDTIQFARDDADFELGGFLVSPAFRNLDSIGKYREETADDNAKLQDVDWMFACLTTLLLRRAAAFQLRYRKNPTLARKLPQPPKEKRSISSFTCLDVGSEVWREEFLTYIPSILKIYENHSHPKRDVEPLPRHSVGVASADRETADPIGNHGREPGEKSSGLPLPSGSHGKDHLVGVDREGVEGQHGHHADPSGQHPEGLEGIAELYRRAFRHADGIAGCFEVVARHRGILEAAAPQIEEILELERKRKKAAALGVEIE